MVDTNKKVSLKNLANWDLTFKRINTLGDVIIPARGKITMLAEEVMSQIYNNNCLFTGDDGKGAHARIFIEDEEIRLEAEFESKEDKREQEILTDQVLEKIFSLKKLASFKKNVEEKVATQAEKAKVIEYAKAHEINDHDKIEFIEEYTGFKLENSQ